MAAMLDEPFRLAAIVFEPGEDPDAPLGAFLASLTTRGLRVGGLVQEHGQADGCDLHDVRVRNLLTGERLDVMQNLGALSSACRVDPGAIAVAARQLAEALATRPDLLVANRFGRLESEGGGAIAEIGQAVVEGVALVVCVPRRYLKAWNDFACGLDRQLPARLDALEAWWRDVAYNSASTSLASDSGVSVGA